MLKPLSIAAAAAFLLGQIAQAEPLLTFDVAEDHTRVAIAPQPLHENGMPAHGNAFVTQGYIYPSGTLEAGTSGVLEDGSPAFPDLVLGTWTCDGYFVGAGGNATTGVWIISRQIFAFNDGDTVVTHGTEIADVGVENLRPITGATGDYAALGGGLIQTTLGFNDYMAINATFVFEAKEDHANGIAPAPTTAITKAAFDQVGPVEAELEPTDQLEWDSGVPVGPLAPHGHPSS